MRQLNRTPGANYQTFRKGIEHPDPAICANVIVGLIKVTQYLLNRLLQRLERDFLQQGGLRERMTRARLNYRAKQRPLRRILLMPAANPRLSPQPAEIRFQSFAFLNQSVQRQFGVAVGGFATEDGGQI